METYSRPPKMASWVQWVRAGGKAKPHPHQLSQDFVRKARPCVCQPW